MNVRGESKWRVLLRVGLPLVVGVVLIARTGCGPSEPEPGQSIEERFADMEQVDLDVKGTAVRAWVARSGNQLATGLMFVDADDIAAYDDGTEKGMFFYFDSQRSANAGFYMKNVPIPLDIAFLKESGEVVTVETMAPFDLRSTFPDGPYRFTLEVRGGLMKNLGLVPGDVVAIPDAILNSSR